MIDWISKEGRERKARDKREKELKQSLAEKVSQYQQASEKVSDDHTEVFIGGKKLRVAKEQITIKPIDGVTVSKYE